MSKHHSFRRHSSQEVIAERVVAIERFLQDTSLHGLKYTAQKESNKVEKAFWTLAFLAGLSASIYFVIQIYKSWDEKPIITTVETRNEPIGNILFPAVTICPQNQILSKKLDPLILNYTSFIDVKNRSPLDKRLINGAIGLSLNLDESQAIPDAFSNEISNLRAYFENHTIGFTKVTLEVAPKCEDIVVNCTWKGQHGCQKQMRTILTPLGSCCAFNFPNKAAGEGPANRTAYKGIGFGLQLVLLPRNNDTTNGNNGHYVLIHDHETYPYRPTLKMQVEPGVVLDVAVEPESVESNENVRTVPETKRDCKFQDEYQLRLNVSPTYNNCIMDCLGKFQLETCQCIQPYMAPFLRDVTVCGLAHMGCVREVLMNVTGDLVRLCQCRPPCQEVTYNTEFAVRPVNFVDTMLPTSMYPNVFKNYSVVHVFFKRSRYIKYTSNLRYEWQDFIAAAGGLLGVGVGFSLLSAVEVIYFFGYKFWKNGARAGSATLTDHNQCGVQLAPKANFPQHKVWYEIPRPVPLITNQTNYFFH